MARTGATLLLVTLLFFLAASPWERCEDEGGDCAPACHLFCKDSCTQSPLTEKAPKLGPAPSPERPLQAPDPSPGRVIDPPEPPPPRR